MKHVSSYACRMICFAHDGMSDMDITPLVRIISLQRRSRKRRRTDTHAQVQSDPEGALWRDPPEYFDQIVYPAYVRAHEPIFTDGDIERGQPNGTIQGLVLIDCEKLEMDEVFKRACEAVLDISR